MAHANALGGDVFGEVAEPAALGTVWQMGRRMSRDGLSPTPSRLVVAPRAKPRLPFCAAAVRGKRRRSSL